MKGIHPRSSEEERFPHMEDVGISKLSEGTQNNPSEISFSAVKFVSLQRGKGKEIRVV